MTFFLDTWVLMDYFSEGQRYNASKSLIERISKERAVISTLVVTELKYKLSKRIGKEPTDKVLYLLQSIPNLQIVPVVLPIAKLAADLKLKYYNKKTRPISLADTIHIATAIITECDELYSGDPDFRDIDEIKTLII